MISKELLSEVLGETNPIDEIEVREYTNEIYMGYTNQVGRFINIYELAHRCKEWASFNGVTIASWKNDVSNEWVAVDIESNKQHLVDTEPEAIFQACEFILKEKR